MKNKQFTNKGIMIVKGILQEDETVHGKDFTLFYGDMCKAKETIRKKQAVILYEQVECVHSFFGLLDKLSQPARIEYGAVIREGVRLKEDAVILMGAIVNKDAMIGKRTMIDMNAVIGSGAQIGDDVHVGAGAVIAGMMEPACTTPVIIEDGVFIGANAVVAEGVRIGHHAIIGAGSVVLHDVEARAVMIKAPAEKIRERTVDDEQRLCINQTLRKKEVGDHFFDETMD